MCLGIQFGNLRSCVCPIYHEHGDGDVIGDGSYDYGDGNGDGGDDVGDDGCVATAVVEEILCFFRRFVY